MSLSRPASFMRLGCILVFALTVHAFAEEHAEPLPHVGDDEQYPNQDIEPVYSALLTEADVRLSTHDFALAGERYYGAYMIFPRDEVVALKALNAFLLAAKYDRAGKVANRLATSAHPAIAEYVKKVADLLPAAVDGTRNLDIRVVNAELGEAGNDQAQYLCGFLLWQTEGGGRECINWLRMAAEQGHVDAQTFYGWSVAKGYGGLEADPSEGIQWAKAAAEKGSVDAQERVAYCYCFGIGVQKDQSEALKQWRLAAQHGSVMAMLHLGVAYDEGWSVPSDLLQAAAWFRKAAERNNSEAMCDLADALFSGRGVERKEAEAIGWYQKAASLWNADAQHALGQMYSYGNWLPKSESWALSYYRQAAYWGKARDLNCLAWLLLTATDTSLQDPKKALDLATKAVAKSERKVSNYLDTLALAEFKNGAIDEAIKVEREALDKLPANATTKLRDSLEKHLKEFEAARKSGEQKW